MRITIACPEALQSDANQLAMALGNSTADIDTYKNLSMQDASGNLYAVASFPVADEWLTQAQSELVRPTWDAEQVIDMVAAKRAQSAVLTSATIIPAQPNLIACVFGDDAPNIVTAMGLVAK